MMPPGELAPLYKWMRDAAVDGSVVSLGSMPILRSRHSSGSAEPVTMAIFGMSPSARLPGSEVAPAASGVEVQAGTLAIVVCVRHLPSWITSGMLLPTGAFLSVKLPLESVSVCTTGSPETTPLQRSQLTPSVNGAGVALG